MRILRKASLDVLNNTILNVSHQSTKVLRRVEDIPRSATVRIRMRRSVYFAILDHHFKGASVVRQSGVSDLLIDSC